MLESLVSETYNEEEELDHIFIDDAVIISIEDDEVNGTWVLPLLLGKDINGNDQRWQIGFNGDKLITQYGRVSGKLQTVERKVNVNTSGRNLQQQALLEAKRRYTDKCMEGYHPEGNSPTISVKAMLANKYTNTGKQISNWPAIYYQPKLDGIRCLVYQDLNGVVKLSRENRPRDNIRHIDPQCQLLLSQLNPGSVLDGELYRFGLKFEEISSIVGRKKNISPNEHLIQYWIFDIISDGQFEERYNKLVNAYETVKDQVPDIVIVPTLPLENKEQIMETLSVYEEAGYEGLILRKVGAKSEYKSGRSSNILKVKSFESAEAIVINVLPGTGTEEECAILEVFDPEIQVQFPLRPSGSFDQRKHWLLHPEEIIGKQYTYKCFSRNYGNPPRFPVGIGIRDYE